MALTREELLTITEAIREGFRSTGDAGRSTGPATGARTGASANTLKTVEQYEQELKLIKEVYEGEEELSKLRDLVLTQLNERQRILEEEITIERNAGRTSDERYRELIRNLKQVNEQLKQTKEDLEDVAKATLPKFNDVIDNLTGKLENFVNTSTKAFQFSGMVDYAKKIDSLGASFAKTTGAGRKYLFEARQLNQDLQKFGATTEDAMKSFTDLSMGLTNFTNESIAAQTQIAKTATILDKLGQPAANTAKNVSALKAVLGESNESALELQQTLGNAAFTLGMSVNEINEKFISNLNRLSIYGSGAKDQFVRLQTFAKATNLEVSTLTDLTERLSTFEGSAEFAGRLNAITGKDLFDVTQLTMLEGQDKIDYIVERLQGAGFDLDDPKMMRVIQQASGMDASTFRSMINASGARIADVSDKVSDKMAKGSAELAQNAEQSTTFIQKTEAFVEALQSREATATKALEAYAAASQLQLAALKGTSGVGGAALGVAGTLAGLGAGSFLLKQGRAFFARRRLGKNQGINQETGEEIPGGVDSPAGGIMDEALGRNKKDCIAICDDSLRKLANMLGGGGSDLLGDLADPTEKGKRKGKQSTKSERKAERKIAAKQEAMRRAEVAEKIRPSGASKAVEQIAEAGTKGAGKFGKIGGLLSRLNPFTKIAQKFGEKGFLKTFFKKIVGSTAVGSLIPLAIELFPLMLEGRASGTESKEMGTRLLASIGGLGGSFLGTLLGSLIPGPGNFIGGFLGGLGGEALANFLVEKEIINPEPFGKSFIEIVGGNTDPQLMGTGPTAPNMAGDLYSSSDRFYVGPEGTYQFSDKDLFAAGVPGSFGNVGGSSAEEMRLMKEQNSLLKIIAEGMIKRNDPLFVNGLSEMNSRNAKAFG